MNNDENKEITLTQWFNEINARIPEAYQLSQLVILLQIKDSGLNDENAMKKALKLTFDAQVRINKIKEKNIKNYKISINDEELI